MAPNGLFFSQGNRDALDSVKALRLAKITAVDTVDMVVDIEFLEESSGKTRVPIPMPSAYPGGGIYSVPRKGAVVIVGIRAMQVPIILAYYPFNAFSPDSYYAISKQVFGIPDDLAEGDIFMRPAANAARCVICGVTSSLVAWESNLDNTTLIERCPNCNIPAYVLDENSQIKTLNKLQLGSTFHMRSDGKIFIQGDNLANSEDGVGSQFKIVIDGVTGNVTISDAGDIDLSANGNVNLSGKDIALSATGTIAQSMTSKTENIDGDRFESAVNRTIQASNTLLATATTLSLRALADMSLEADSRTATVGKTDTYATGTLVATVNLNRTVTVKGDDIETVAGSKTMSVGTALSLTVGGGVTVSIGGSETVKIAGSSTTTVTGTHGVTSTGAMSLASSAQMSLNGTTIVLNGGVKAVARKDDATLINNVTDSTFIQFLTDLQTILADIQTVYNLHTHISNVPGNPTGPTNAPSTATVPTPPGTVTGKINAGNNTVLA